MDIHQFYSEKRNFCIVQFENQKGLTVKEIKSVFNQFGNVLNVNASENIDGLHSVMYTNFKGALNCIKGLQDYDIKLFLMNLEDNSNNKKNNNKVRDSTSKRKRSKKIIYKFERLRQLKNIASTDITTSSDRSSKDIFITDEKKLD